MAVTNTSQVLVDGAKTAVIKFTGEVHTLDSDESAALKVDASALENAPTDLKIQRLWSATSGLAVKLYFDADTDVLATVIPADSCGYQDFRSVGGIQNNAGAGVTGDIVATTVGGTVGDSYSITIEVSKS